MLEISLEREMAAPAAEVWELLSGSGGVTTFDALGVPEEALAQGIEGVYSTALDGAAKTFGG